jgi:hypothetical protein
MASRFWSRLVNTSPTLIIDVHMPEVDGLSASYWSNIMKKPRHLVVVTGHPGRAIVEKCRGLDAYCIDKGHNFWNEFEAVLAGIYPKKEVAIRQPGKRVTKIEVKKRPRILWWMTM